MDESLNISHKGIILVRSVGIITNKYWLGDWK